MGHASARMPNAKTRLQLCVKSVRVAHSTRSEVPGMSGIFEASRLVSSPIVTLFVGKTSRCVALRSDQSDRDQISEETPDQRSLCHVHRTQVEHGQQLKSRRMVAELVKATSV